MSDKETKDIFEVLEKVNEHMAGYGFHQKLLVGNDNFQINEKEVIIVVPFSLTLKIPKEEISGNDADVSRAVSHAISQAVSLNK